MIRLLPMRRLALTVSVAALALSAIVAATRRPAVSRVIQARLGNGPVFQDDAAVFLAAGDIDEAITLLERELLQKTNAAGIGEALGASRDANLMNRLAAAYLKRDSSRSPTDFLWAVEAAERAWRIDPSPEIAWNRALAREAMHVRAATLIAWNDVLAAESDPGRRAEALQHVRRLYAPSQSQRWQTIRERLADHLPESAHDFPQEIRLYGEDELLARWAESGDARALDDAERAGAALPDDRMLSDAVRAIRGDARLAAGHRIYAKARRSLADQQMLAAVDEFAEAAGLLAGSPFALRAELYRASAEYSAARLDAAVEHLRDIERSPEYDPTRYPSLQGQVQWVAGLIALSLGRNREALRAFHDALEAFERSRERESRVGIESLLAETYRDVGQTKRSWEIQRQALATLEVLGRTRRSHAILTDAAIGANALGAPLAAMIFQGRVVALAHATADAVSMCDALVGRSTYASAAGDHARAEADLAEAGALVARISDRAMRDRSLGNLLAAQAAVHRAIDPHRAAREASSAIAQMKAVTHRIRLVELDLEAGKSFDEIGASTDALGLWSDGITECEARRSELDVDEFRRTYLETCRSLFEESIRVLTRERRFADAFHLADRSRARGLFDRRRSDVDALVDIPTNVTIVEYAVLPDHLIVWALRGDRLVAVAQPIPRSRLRGLIEAQIASRSDALAFQRASADLFDVLIRPIQSELSEQVVFIPEDDLYRVAFAALFDRNANRHLVETYEISLAPSLALLRIPERSRGVTETVLIDAGSVGNRYRDAAVELPGASREIAELRVLYPSATVIASEECTRDNVRAALIHGGIVHFAGHAVTASKAEDAALILRPGEHDAGVLYPREISDLDVRAQLVVLGACATAEGPIGSEGPLSVARAFLAAGTSRVVATLWEIDDASSSHWLVDFHRALSQGSGAERALRQIQRQAIETSAPATEWAAFEVLRTKL